MNTTRIPTIAHDGSAPIAARPIVRGRLGVALLAAALVSAAACGSDSTTQAGSGSSTNAATTSSTPSTSTTSVVTPTTTATTEAPPTPTVARPTATIDELVGADGARVHVRCVGQGDTTVVLIAGFGGDTTGWVNVEPAIAASARVCSYDRPGTGTSDPATATTTFTTEATDLHDLLSTLGEPGPYVVVGHSFGGAEAIAFASLFADEVTGLALIDASPHTWPDAVCAVADDGSVMAAMMQANCTAAFLPTGNPERLDVVAAFAEMAQIHSLGSTSMAVITATERDLGDLTAPEVARLTEVWDQGQQAWMALSTDVRLVSVDHTGHHIELDQPGVVIDEITRLLP
jgi:pimeloyl-ACP methyl ester carboxylesterase